jgi:vacuolar-type H+-ATPase subunit E/Vma4
MSIINTNEPTAAVDPDLAALESALTAARIEGRREVIRDYEADLERLNDILNDAAQQADLCSQYEAALDRVNAACTRIHLVGRERDYTTNLTVTVSFQSTPDNAESEAQNIAENISAYVGELIDVSVDYVSED